MFLLQLLLWFTKGLIFNNIRWEMCPYVFWSSQVLTFCPIFMRKCEGLNLLHKDITPDQKDITSNWITSKLSSCFYWLMKASIHFITVFVLRVPGVNYKKV